MNILYDTDNPALKKDVKSKAVINTDLASYNRYMMEKRKRQEAEQLKSRLEVVEKQNAEIVDRLDSLNTKIDELFIALMNRDKG